VNNKNLFNQIDQYTKPITLKIYKKSKSVVQSWFSDDSEITKAIKNAKIEMTGEELMDHVQSIQSATKEMVKEVKENRAPKEQKSEKKMHEYEFKDKKKLNQIIRED
jgi:gas vesicle protein